MNINEIRLRVATIELTGRDDPEKAHSMEDTLYGAILLAIAEGHPDPDALAREALRTKKLAFPRWAA
jgi:hypothetical protein